MRIAMKIYGMICIYMLLSLAIVGCDGFFGEGDELPDQEILFEYAYVNHAWGYQHSGWLIDSSGNVYCFDQPGVWNFPDSSGSVGKTEMLVNLVEADSICFTVDKSEVEKFAGKLQGAAKGEISSPRNVMADAGTWGYYGWRFDTASGMYHRILLKEGGDWERENISRDAEAITDWLEGIREEITER